VAVLLSLGERAAGWSHGYDLCRSLELKSGTVYPILIRLADRGLVETTWEQQAAQGRPARHLYRLSSAGAEFAAGLRATRNAAPGKARSAVVAAPRPAAGTAGT
jgi:PadR family transcriptional regulator, regulatory protein PadR